MLEIVIKGKKITMMKAMHLSVDENYIIYDDYGEEIAENQVIFFDEKDVEKIIITPKENSPCKEQEPHLS